MVCSGPRRTNYLLAPLRGTEGLLSHHYFQAATIKWLFFCLLTLVTRKRVYIFFLSSLHFFYYIYIISTTLHSKYLFPYLYSKFAYLSKIIYVLLNFKYIINSNTLILYVIYNSMLYMIDCQC